MLRKPNDWIALCGSWKTRKWNRQLISTVGRNVAPSLPSLLTLLWNFAIVIVTRPSFVIRCVLSDECEHAYAWIYESMRTTPIHKWLTFDRTFERNWNGRLTIFFRSHWNTISGHSGSLLLVYDAICSAAFTQRPHIYNKIWGARQIVLRTLAHILQFLCLLPNLCAPIRSHFNFRKSLVDFSWRSFLLLCCLWSSFAFSSFYIHSMCASRVSAKRL